MFWDSPANRVHSPISVGKAGLSLRNVAHYGLRRASQEEYQHCLARPFAHWLSTAPFTAGSPAWPLPGTSGASFFHSPSCLCLLSVTSLLPLTVKLENSMFPHLLHPPNGCPKAHRGAPESASRNTEADGCDGKFPTYSSIKLTRTHNSTSLQEAVKVSISDASAGPTGPF